MLDSLKLIHRKAGQSRISGRSAIVSGAEVCCYFVAKTDFIDQAKRDKNPYSEIHTPEMLSGDFGNSAVAGSE